MQIELPREQNAALELLRLEDTRTCRVASLAPDAVLPSLTHLYATGGAFADTQTLTRLLATPTLSAVTLECMRLGAEVMCDIGPAQASVRALTLRGCDTSLDFLRAVARRYTHLEDLRVVDCEKDGGTGAIGDQVQSLHVVNSHVTRVKSVIDVDQALACLAGAVASVARRLLHVQMPSSPRILFAPPPTTLSSSSAVSTSSFMQPIATEITTRSECETKTQAGQPPPPPLLDTALAPTLSTDTDDTDSVDMQNKSATCDRGGRNAKRVDWRADASTCRVILWNKADASGTHAPPDAVSIQSLGSQNNPRKSARLINVNCPFVTRCEASVYSPGLALMTIGASDCVVTLGPAIIIVSSDIPPGGVRMASTVPLRHWNADFVRAMQAAEIVSALPPERSLPLSTITSLALASRPPSRTQILAVDADGLGKVTQTRFLNSSRRAHSRVSTHTHIPP
jgi:hypothetical protein